MLETRPFHSFLLSICGLMRCNTHSHIVTRPLDLEITIGIYTHATRHTLPHNLMVRGTIDIIASETIISMVPHTIRLGYCSRWQYMYLFTIKLPIGSHY